jgi:hypothetical protein
MIFLVFGRNKQRTEQTSCIGRVWHFAEQTLTHTATIDHGSRCEFVLTEDEKACKTTCVYCARDFYKYSI